MSSRRKHGFAAEWPLVAFTTALQWSAGIALSVAIARPENAAALRVIAFFLIAAGAGVSLVHLGRPLRAWRAVLNVQSSPVSRELAATGVFALAVMGSVVAGSVAADALSAAAGLTAVVASACVYLYPTDSVSCRARVMGMFVVGAGAAALVAASALVPSAAGVALACIAASLAAVACARQIHHASRRFACKGLRQAN